MKRVLSVVLFASLLIAGFAFAAGAPFVDPELFGGLVLAQTLPSAIPQSLPWRRVRKDLPSFENIVASGRATTEIPRYAMTLLGIQCQLGGTTFNESHVTEVRLRLGSKTIWGPVTGAHLRKINAYKGYYNGNRQFMHIDFLSNRAKNMGGAMVGGIDMSKLPAGKLQLEVATLSATGPTLDAKGHWGPPQANDVMQKLLQYPWSTSGTGRRVVPFEFRGARVRRMFAIYAGTDWAEGTATATAFTGNTGDGVMGAVTVLEGAKVGTHKLVIVEPGSNVGTFVIIEPDGVVAPEKGVVASAYANASLSFTLADGSTDFGAGDGFDIVVSENNNGNLSRGEVRKNGEDVWDLECAQARQLQKQYGLVPQEEMYVFDFEVDGWPDGALPTADVITMEWAVHLTAADDVTFYAEVLDRPDNN